MILHTFTLTLGSTRPIHGTAPGTPGILRYQVYRVHRTPPARRGQIHLPVPGRPVQDDQQRPHRHRHQRRRRGIKKIYDEYQEIRLGANTYQIVERGIALKDEEFGISDKIRSYEFATPWLALNQENYKRFYALKGKEERDEFVRKILIGNIISMSKSLGYEVPAQIKCDTNLHFQKDRLKDVSVMTFTGKFHVNFLIPDYLGLGKSVSRGFGAVKQRTLENEKD